MIEICSFGKETILSHPKHTVSSPTPPVGSLGLPFYSLWPCPAEFSPASGSECPSEVGLSEHISQEGFCRNQMGECWVVWLNPTVGALLSPL